MTTPIRAYRITIDYKGFKRYVYGEVLTGNAQVVYHLGGTTEENTPPSE